jgi:hypothetical protein
LADSLALAVLILTSRLLLNPLHHKGFFVAARPGFELLCVFEIIFPFQGVTPQRLDRLT